MLHSTPNQNTTLRWLIVIGCVILLTQENGANASLLVEAHRGDSSSAPENTLASIQSAVGSADLTEMDVRVSKDGQLVLMHDASLSRTTDGRGAVKRKTLLELQTLDAGTWFSDVFALEPIPTLQQAIDFSMTVGI